MNRTWQTEKRDWLDKVNDVARAVWPTIAAFLVVVTYFATGFIHWMFNI